MADTITVTIPTAIYEAGFKEVRENPHALPATTVTMYWIAASVEGREGEIEGVIDTAVTLWQAERIMTTTG